MYSQGLDDKNLDTDQNSAQNPNQAFVETPEFLAAFQARIDADQKIEPNDAMPESIRIGV